MTMFPVATIVSGIIQLLTLSAAVAANTTEDSYVVSFTRHVGRLAIVDQQAAPSFVNGSAPKGFDWEAHSQEARGEVRIPAGKKVLVQIFSDDSAPPLDLTVLNQFHPEDLHLLAIVFARIGPRSLKPLQRHKELRCLILGPQYQITDEGLAPLSEVTSLQTLQISDSGQVHVTDKGLRPIGQLRNLQSLRISGLDVTDDGLKHLQNLSKLRELDLAATRVSNGGLRHLQKLAKLRVLDLAGTNVSDVATRYLSHMKSLESLNLDGTRVVGEGLSRLESLSNLRSISLGRTKLDDTSDGNLPLLPKLETLDLTDTNISDRGLARLPTFPDLHTLKIARTDITDEGVCAFKSRYTGLKVIRGNGQDE